MPSKEKAGYTILYTSRADPNWVTSEVTKMQRIQCASHMIIVVLHRVLVKEKDHFPVKWHVLIKHEKHLVLFKLGLKLTERPWA